ncbi:hypothetical protein N5C81_14930 [Rhizobium pusense]|uniref:hypothetical protein n=1 Tax=Agrobacterium pusense TaxID=648995 RepID=UPI00244BFDA3|nr:hypothetical protein [Agrobacterium pusense]MDH1268917.1 hypothetical protein [Agrobacterium pusense]
MTDLEVIYRGEDVAVFADIKDMPEDLLTVTFTPRLLIDRDISGDLSQFSNTYAFFKKRNIPSMCIVSRTSCWWQTPDAWAAIEAVRRHGILNRYSRRWAYSSSMGATGALMFASGLELDGVLAVAPQYSLDPNKTPWDDRWKIEQQRFPIINDRLDPSPDTRKVIFYDPLFQMDKRHVDKIIEEIGGERVKVPFALHSVQHVLLECGMLGDAVLQVIHGTFNHVEFTKLYRQRRSQSAMFLRTASLEAFRRRRFKHALHLSERAIDRIEVSLADRALPNPPEFLYEMAGKHHLRCLEAIGNTSGKKEFVSRWQPFFALDG